MDEIDISFDDPKQVESALKELLAEVKTIKGESEEYNKKYENLKTAITSGDLLASVEEGTDIHKGLVEAGIEIPKKPEPVKIDPEIQANIDIAKRTIAEQLQASYALVQSDPVKLKEYAATISSLTLSDLVKEKDNPYRLAAENLAKEKIARPVMAFNGNANNSGTSLEDLLK